MMSAGWIWPEFYLIYLWRSRPRQVSENGGRWPPKSSLDFLELGPAKLSLNRRRASLPSRENNAMSAGFCRPLGILLRLRYGIYGKKFHQKEYLRL